MRDASLPSERSGIGVRRLRWAGSWLLLTGWIALPLMPAVALGLSKLLGLGF